MRYTIIRQMQGYTYKLATNISLIAAANMIETLRSRGIHCTMRAWIPGETCL